MRGGFGCDSLAKQVQIRKGELNADYRSESASTAGGRSNLAFGNWGVVGPDAGNATFVEVCSEAGAQLLQDAVKAAL